MAGKTKMEKRWGAERGSKLHDRALKATKLALDARGYEVVWDNGFECSAGAVDLIVKDDCDLAFVDVFVNDDPTAEDFPAERGRHDLGKIEAAFRSRLKEVEPLAWSMIPSGRSYFQFHLNAVDEGRAVMRSAECPVIGGIARFTSEEALDADADCGGACADKQALLETERFLERRGYKIVASEGFACEAGAIDIVVEDELGEVVFVKVSSREAGAGEPAKLSPGRRWFEKILHAFCREHAELTGRRMRLDLVNVSHIGEGRALIKHHIAAHSC